MKTPFVFLFGLVILLAIIVYDNPIVVREKGEIKPFINKETTIVGDFVELDYPQPSFAVRAGNGKIYQIIGDKLQEVIAFNNLSFINKIEVTGELTGRDVTTFGADVPTDFMIDLTSFKVLSYKKDKIDKPFAPKIVTVQGSIFTSMHPSCCYSFIRLEDVRHYKTVEYLLRGDKIERIPFDNIDEIKVTGLLSEEKIKISQAGGFADWKTKVINVISFEIISYKQEN